MKCTCGEPPYTGHYLWCASLRGQREYRPATPGAMTDVELQAVKRLALAQHDDAFAEHVDLAISGDPTALQVVCNVLNARARNGCDDA